MFEMSKKTRAWVRWAVYLLTTGLMGLVTGEIVTDAGWVQAITVATTAITGLATAVLGKQLVSGEIKGAE